MKEYCISVNSVRYKMELLNSDLEGFYLYKLIPMGIGHEPGIIYIAPNREEHWMNGKPMEGGKQIKNSEIFYFYTYK